MKNKFCSNCKKELSLNSFYKDSRSSDGKQSVCKICQNKQRSDSYKLHRALGDSVYWDGRAMSINARVKHRHKCKDKITGEQLYLKFRQQKKKCFYCGRRLNHKDVVVDHVLPLSKGGDNVIQNVVISCAICNRIKDNLTVVEFKSYMKRILSNLDNTEVILRLNALVHRRA